MQDQEEPRTDRQRPDFPVADRIAIFGAGPLGLETAHYAARLGFSVRVFESSGEVAPRVRAWRHLGMFSPWGSLRTELGASLLRGKRADNSAGAARRPRAGVYPTAEEFVRLYLEPLAAALPAKSLWLDHKVVGLTRAYLFPTDHAELPMLRVRHPFRIVTRNTATGEERAWSAEYVIDCTSGGRVPAWIGCGGLPAIGEMGITHLIHRLTPDIAGAARSHFAGKKTLLVGDGSSAATSAVLLSDLAESSDGTQIYWAVRTDRELPCVVDRAAPSSRRTLTLSKANLLVKSAKPYLMYSNRTQVEEIKYNYEAKKFFATLQVDRQTKRYQFDQVIANTGSRIEPAYLAQIIAGEPGFHVVGADRCAGEQNVLESGHAQIRDIFQQIVGDRALNLYEAQEKAA